MRKWLFALLSAVLLFPVAVPQILSSEAAIVASAEDIAGVQVPIPMEFRVYNTSGSQCVWCSLTCLARYHKIEAASHLTDKYKHATGEGEVRRVLDSLNVKYSDCTNKNPKFLEEACAKGWGAGVGLNGTHMVNVVHFKDGVVKIIDNSDSKLRVQTWTMEQFMKRWDGWGVTLIPPGKPGDGAPNKHDAVILSPRPPSAIQ